MAAAGIALAAGCGSPAQWTSNLTYTRQARVRLVTRTADQEMLDCLAGCQQPRGIAFGDCLALCPGHLIEPGSCLAEEPGGEVCANRVQTWSEVHEGRCSDQSSLGPGTTIVQCTEKAHYPASPKPSAAGQVVIGALIFVVVVLPLYFVFSSCPDNNCIIH